MNLEFNNITELHKYLIDNKKTLTANKMQATKYADGIPYFAVSYSVDKDIADKAESSTETLREGEIQVKVVINTTNLIDSHKDCHIPGLWKKSLNENKKLKLLKSHRAEFEDIISDKVIATAKNISWKTLGYNFEGNTQALIFDATVEEKRNPYMFGQYKQGYVDNHSVGMRYVKLFMCVNSNESWASEEKANWDKYYEYVANKSVADEQGYFWAVTEAKVIEGSAVVFGSNYATPTLSVKSYEPLNTPKAEPLDTQIDINEFKNELKKQFKNLQL